MKMKKILSVLVASTMIATAIPCSAMVSFNDVSSKTHSWAIEAIESMAEREILKGYDKDTFGPDDAITKIQALIIMSRILGVNNADNSYYVDLATEKYEKALEAYETEYKKEVSYLLYRGVISENELSNYISDNEINSPLKRYEAAVLLTKLDGAENMVLEEGYSNLDFKDSADIPTKAKPYVAFVKEKGLMNGVSETEFAPKTSVTRAMMSTMMYRTEKAMDVETAEVEITNVDSETGKVKVESGTYDEEITFSDSVRIVIDGEETPKEELMKGATLIIYSYDGEIVFVEGTNSSIQTTETGTVLSVSTSASARKIAITPSSASSSEKATYTLDSKCNIYIDGSGSTITQITQGTYVKLPIKGGLVTRIDASKKEMNLDGKITETNFTNEGSEITIEAKGEDYTYSFADEVKVTRNTIECDIRDLAVGDTVKATIFAGKIKKIAATSVNKTVEGTIEEIHITSSPSIIVNVAGAKKTYGITSQTVFNIESNEEGTIYDLRLGATASIKLSSDNVEEISTKKVIATPALIGTVNYVYPSNRVIGIDVIDTKTGETTTVSAIVKSTCTITDVTSSKITSLKGIEPGRGVVAVGTANYGAYEVTSITITN